MIKRFKTSVERVLSRFGVLDGALRFLRKVKLKCGFAYRYFSFMMIGSGKKKYLEYFDRTYRSRLKTDIYNFGVRVDRYESFRRIFKELLSRKDGDFTIIETGCAQGAWAAGNSSLLFYEFLNIFGGKLVSIDISEKNMNACRAMLKSHVPATGRASFEPIVGDAIAALRGIQEKPDLLYLDSYDLDTKNPVPSMLHHMEELRSAKDMLMRSDDPLLAVDDNFKGSSVGKGKYIAEWALETGQELLFDGYQIIFQLKSDKIAGL